MTRRSRKASRTTLGDGGQLNSVRRAFRIEGLIDGGQRCLGAAVKPEVSPQEVLGQRVSDGGFGAQGGGSFIPAGPTLRIADE
ncbi:MAG TPA: hypothetical protein VJN18_15045 [Polyangiaceae bacterium]|nr:hypothetical protein [Polyangiaceae bacterium]